MQVTISIGVDSDTVKRILEGQKHMGQALDDLKAAQTALTAGVNDAVAALKGAAEKLAGGISADEAEAVADDLKAKAAALEAAVAPVA